MTARTLLSQARGQRFSPPGACTMPLAIFSGRQEGGSQMQGKHSTMGWADPAGCPSSQNLTALTLTTGDTDILTASCCLLRPKGEKGTSGTSWCLSRGLWWHLASTKPSQQVGGLAWSWPSRDATTAPCLKAWGEGKTSKTNPQGEFFGKARPAAKAVGTCLRWNKAVFSQVGSRLGRTWDKGAPQGLGVMGRH